MMIFMYPHHNQRRLLFWDINTRPSCYCLLLLCCHQLPRLAPAVCDVWSLYPISRPGESSIIQTVLYKLFYINSSMRTVAQSTIYNHSNKMHLTKCSHTVLYKYINLGADQSSNSTKCLLLWMTLLTEERMNLSKWKQLPVSNNNVTQLLTFFESCGSHYLTVWQ